MQKPEPGWSVVRAAAIASALVIAAAAPCAAQGAPASQPRASNAAPRGSTAMLAEGWTALAAGRTADAIRVSTALLADPWASHDAAALRIAAELPRVGPALDGYERWLAVSRREDVFLLRPIAHAALTAHLGNRQPRIWVAAAAALAAAGDPDARAKLEREGAAATATVEVLSALAAAGSAPAIARLTEDVAAGGPRDKSAAIVALRDSGSPTAADAIVAALRDPAPTSKMSAAYALATLGATQAIPALRAALADPDPAVRGMVRLALARLGDATAGSLDEFAKSPVADVRLQIAQSQAARGAGAWADTARALLQDPDAQIRIRAAGLLLAHGVDTELAAGALQAAAADENPASRLAAAQTAATLAKSVESDLPAVRRLLRDPQPDVAIEAATAVLRRSGPRGR